MNRYALEERNQISFRFAKHCLSSAPQRGQLSTELSPLDYTHLLGITSVLTIFFYHFPTWYLPKYLVWPVRKETQTSETFSQVSKRAFPSLPLSAHFVMYASLAYQFLLTCGIPKCTMHKWTAHWLFTHSQITCTQTADQSMTWKCFLGCWDKVPQTRWLKTSETFFSPTAGARNLKLSCWQDHSSEALRETLSGSLLALMTAGSPQHPLTCRRTTPISASFFT